ncbi:hypothetical protein SDC9_46657 [bioreactor metagenome]|uniref:DUF2158 domain-containing protein n=1 Tax=bioreactor metagenome TaxID=1076179 RepID=A0A644WCY9_9ZZZZ
MELKVGDIVMLKSGGPNMTIAEFGDYNYSGREQAKCVWFQGIKRYEDIFEKDTLVTLTQITI